MHFKGLSLLLLLLVGVVSGQYNYKPPPPPPPKPNPTYLPPQSSGDALAEGLSPDGEHEPGMPFDFTYAVKEDDGNDFQHQAQSDGDVVTGEYRILLPDTRVQVVKYTADWKNGYNAEITYEGEAVYPEPKPTTPKPYKSSADVASQGITPGYNYNPPPRQQPTRPPTTRPPPPPPPPGLYGAPSNPFGVRVRPPRRQ